MIFFQILIIMVIVVVIIGIIVIFWMLGSLIKDLWKDKDYLALFFVFLITIIIIIGFLAMIEMIFYKSK